MPDATDLTTAALRFVAAARLVGSVCLVVAAFCNQALWAAEDEPYVLLTNGNVLRGVAQVSGDLVILHRGDGSELKIRSTDVAYSAYDLRDVYRYRIARRESRTPAMISDDAHWCLRQNLLDEADTELTKLEAADSGYPTLPRLKRQLAVARNPSTAASNTMEPASMAAMASHTEPARHEPPTANLSGVSSQSLVDFTTRLQPMLIKSCGATGCHRTGSETQWQLSHFGLSTRVSARMTQLNLSTTLAFASSEQPESSLILRFATTPHGKDYKATERADLLTQQTLRSWLMNCGSYPQPHTPIPGVTSAAPIAPSLPGFAPSLPGFASSGNMTASSNIVPTPRAINTIGLSNAGQAGFPQSVPLPTPAPLPFDNDAPPEGFIADENGEWIYEPEGGQSFDKHAVPLQSANKPPQTSVPTLPQTASDSKDSGLRNRNRPMRLPTVENPVSADRFNRQHQLLAPSSAAK